MSNYGTAIDKKWQKKWEETELYKFNPDAEGEKLYVLEMFSYPSGSQLHAGHWFNYGPVDSWARLKKMQGYNSFNLSIHTLLTLKTIPQLNSIVNVFSYICLIFY